MQKTLESFEWKVKIDGKEYGSLITVGKPLKEVVDNFTDFITVINKQIGNSLRALKDK